MTNMKSGIRSACLCCTALVSLAGIEGVARAQEAEPVTESADAPSAPIEDIVITGTRIKRDGYDAPTPLTVVDAATITRAAPANVADFVNQLPQLTGSSTPRTGNGGTSTGTAGLNLLDLRGLGPNRTLVLLDGQRVAPSTQTGAVDVNNIPSALLQRVDVVTGGASAAYGSDAVAGVVNFIIDGKFEGLKANIMGGVTDRGDNRNYLLSGAFGKSFADGRGHVLFSVDHQHEDGIDYLDRDKRDWYTATYLVNNPAYVAGNGQPRFIVSPNVSYNNVAQGGVITTTALAGTQFGTGGDPFPFNYGTIAGNFMIGGTTWNEGDVVALTPRLDRTTAWGRASYEFSSLVKASLEASFGKTHTVGSAAYQRYAGNLTVSASNPFLPQSVRDAAAASSITSFRYGYSTYDLGRPVNDISRENYRLVGTLQGEFAPGWSWEAYYQYGRTDIDVNLRNTTDVARFAEAIDAVTDPATGRIVCRSTLANPGNGCVPLNIFGIGVASPEAIAYVKGVAWQKTSLTQKVAAASVSGTVGEIWAGPVSVAAGVEHRSEAVDAVGDTLSATNGWYTGNFKSNAGSYSVNEAFAEVVVPLLKDSRFGESADFNGAVRLTDYSTSGTVVTWKAGFSYQPIPDIRFRAVFSRDIRAPSLSELYLAGATNAIDVIDPLNGNNTFRVTQYTDGNVDLVPEKANTVGLGVVLRPRFLPGFSVSFDYYNIRLKDAITTLAANDIVARCIAGETELCTFVTRDASNVITAIRRVPINVAKLRVRGFDIDATYRLPLDTLFGGAEGDISLRFLANRALNYAFTNNNITNEAVGENGGPQASPAIPRWRTLTTLAYDGERLNLDIAMRTISAGVYDVSWVSGVDIDNNHIDGATYFDLGASYRVLGDSSRNLELYVRIENLFDRDPPIAAQNFSSGLQTNTALYDVLGRAWRAGLRIRY